MKFLAKIALVTAATGGAVTMYAAPGGVSISAQDMIAQANALHEQILTDYRHVEHLQLVARKDKDIIKLNCVNDKLVQIKPEMNIVDRARTELLSGGVDQQVAFAQVTEAGDAVRQLREAADQCIGQPMLVTKSSNEYTHPNIPDNPTDNPLGSSIEAPAYASPVN